MADNSLTQRTAQLDKAEREHLEDIVVEMRERVENNVEFQLEQAGLDDEPDDLDSVDEETRQLVEAIELEAVDGESWTDAFEQYVTGVGYTIVNRLAALRCMEVRNFLDEEVTVFKENGLTPAAETLVHEEFLLEDEAILAAYHNSCDDLAEEIDILFDRSTAYSLIDPDDDTYEDLCSLLDDVPDAVWRADDVLGWVYEYYNVKLLDDLRRKGDREGLEPEDVPPANQFYTPHWVVRMLTDNSLGKLYLEDRGDLQETVARQDALTPEERKDRPLSPDESPDIADFCTYLVPSEEAGEPTEFDHPKELSVIDPACGSGHFLLYAFDVLERIWRAETDRDHADIPRAILRHNLHGVDLDMRACQLAAFNLYLKGRTRAEAEGASGFDMPEVGIVCADASVADVDGVEAVFAEVADGDPEVADALRRILDAFEEVHGLGSLLDVRGTLGDLFEDEVDEESVQISLEDDPTEDYNLSEILSSLRDAVDEQQETDSFLAQDLRSFVRLLDILAQDYDVALMNPPYGSVNRIPDSVEDYIEQNYEYASEFYINFFEVCDRVTKESGRVGMLVPWTFMFKKKFREFREDFIGNQGGFDFLAEFGYGVLDNATVGTVGTVVTSGGSEDSKTGSFIRLHDIGTKEKEETYEKAISGRTDDVKRIFNIDLQEFSKVPRTPICYSIPEVVRDLHSVDKKLDAEQANIEGESVCEAIPGLQTSYDLRFVRHHWVAEGDDEFQPIAKGGSDAWLIPRVIESCVWNGDGNQILRSNKSARIRNKHRYGQPGLTWTYIKRTGRRFGYYPGGLFSHTGLMLFPKGEQSLWRMMSILNSSLYHNLFLSITTERHWNPGEVGSLPWIDSLNEVEELDELGKEQYQIKLVEKLSDPTSPFYTHPDLYPSNDLEFFYGHTHPEKIGALADLEVDARSISLSLAESARRNEQQKLRRQQELERISDDIDDLIFEKLSINREIQKNIRQEIFLRTSEDPEDRQVPDPESVPEEPENLDEQVADLVHHFALEVIRDESDGIVPLHGTDGQPAMLDRIVERFEDCYGEYATDRLAEVDDILGAQSAGEEAYPNLRRWVAEDLFDYHVDTMENTPILWRLTTERLLADSAGEGFACFLDYHSIDSGLFDRLSNQYLEPRKADLRERKSAADRRRNDDSLSASEQAEAVEQYDRCASGLDQINRLEDVLQELGSTDERAFGDDDRTQVEALAPKVAAFREETRERVETLAELRERNTAEWFQDTFSDNFWNAVEEWREEWIDALGELERACEEYAKPADEPVEAHLADLFDYFDWRLKGSDYHSSSGILFLTYYFEREGADLLDDDGEPFDNLTDDERLLASLATGLDDSSILDEEYLQTVADDQDVEDVDDLPPLAEFKALAEEIDDRCQAVSRGIPSDWADRALSEITTAGYRPNRKHGVEINIRPLADTEIVPKTVDDHVL